MDHTDYTRTQRYFFRVMSNQPCHPSYLRSKRFFSRPLCARFIVRRK
jgi:hypothetical protein